MRSLELIPHYTSFIKNHKIKTWFRKKNCFNSYFNSPFS